MVACHSCVLLNAYHGAESKLVLSGYLLIEEFLLLVFLKHRALISPFLAFWHDLSLG